MSTLLTATAIVIIATTGSLLLWMGRCNICHRVVSHKKLMRNQPHGFLCVECRDRIRKL
jgi:hypothetical protein